MARHPLVVDLFNDLKTPKNFTGRRKAASDLFEELATKIATNLEDCTELVDALSALKLVRNRTIQGFLNPTLISTSVPRRAKNPSMHATAPAPEVTVGDEL